MKKIIFVAIILFTALNVCAQNISDSPIQNISTDTNVIYRLFSTRNMHTFLKLDTRNGQIWQVQWSAKGNEFETPLSLIMQVSKEEEKNGRFFLYPTTNIYNFILLDQIDGRVWQVQWSSESEKRILLPIKLD